MTRLKLVKRKRGRVNQRGDRKWKNRKCKKRNEKKKETTEDLIRLTWAIREHIGHFV